MHLSRRITFALSFLLQLSVVNSAALADPTDSDEVITATTGFYSSLVNSSSSIYWRRDGDVYKPTLSKTGNISGQCLPEKTVPVGDVAHFKRLIELSKNCAVPCAHEATSDSCFSNADRTKLLETMRENRPELYVFFQKGGWRITDSDLCGAMTRGIPYTYHRGLMNSYAGLEISGNPRLVVELNEFPQSINCNSQEWHTYSPSIPREASKFFISPLRKTPFIDPATDIGLVEFIAAELINNHAQDLWEESTKGLPLADSLLATEAEIELGRSWTKQYKICLTLISKDPAAIISQYYWNTNYSNGKITGVPSEVLENAIAAEKLAKSIPWLRKWASFDKDCSLYCWLPFDNEWTISLIDHGRQIGFFRLSNGGTKVQTTFFNNWLFLPSTKTYPPIPSLPSKPEFRDLSPVEVTSVYDEPQSISRYLAARKHFFVDRWIRPTKLIWKCP